MENLVKTYHDKVEGTPSDMTPVVPESVYYSEVYGKNIKKDVSATCWTAEVIAALIAVVYLPIALPDRYQCYLYPAKAH